MDSSILKDVKQALGVEESSTSFDKDIIIFTNAALFVLPQLGVGPPDGFSISDDSATWEDVILDRSDLIGGVKAFVCLDTRLKFDPPQMGYYVNLMKEQVEELKWRIVSQVESKTS